MGTVGIAPGVARPAGRTLPGRLGPQDRPSGHVPARFGLFAIATVSLAVAVALYVTEAYMPQGAIALPFSTPARALVHMVVPEGWAFFTRDPREERLFPYVQRDGHWVSVHAAPHAEPQHAFGLDRVSRAQGVELGMLFGSVPTPAWTTCASRDLEACLSSAPTGLTIRNTSPDPTICGDAAIVRQEPLPWAWAHTATVMPIKFARMVVRC